MDRREFLQYSSLISAAGIMPEMAFAQRPARQRIVVFVELKGGNDGFNTLVPYTDPAYREQRPTIRLDERKVLKLEKEMGLHPHLKDLMPYWNRGQMAWIQGVGYPSPVLSHFRSMDIWDTGSNANQILEDGWLSQILPRYKDGLHGICVSPDGSSLGPLGSSKLNSVSMQSPRMFVNQSSQIEDIIPVNSTAALAHLTRTQHQLYDVGYQLRSKMMRNLRQKPNRRAKGVLGHSLESVAQMIIAGIDSPVYKVTQDGFDTHSGQVGRHNNVMHHVGKGLAAFANTMKAKGLWDDVLVVTYSEFGRRIGENRGGGTDHGTASSQLIMGGRVRGGLYGRHPDLGKLDANGNVAHTTDFRQVYATICQRWWQQNHHPWQGHKTIPFV
ncbi:DUF1501 domain-containing protein [Leucothrix mucor]|uniref:DUF1501 domain-containing protein n=1 Tax=Leucothrix mucor TaxID=45248 RepID=UPI0003B53A61|nr:DUF1501 domain-containing protein [Leucothrix mucor]